MLDVQNGVSARGPWSKQEFVIEYQEGNFPTQICLNVWGEDKVKDLGRFNIGDRVKISFNLSSREYNGRLRKYYAITPRGMQKINEFLEDMREFEIIYHLIQDGEKK